MSATLVSLERCETIVIGRESVGKSQLISSLTGVAAGESNFRGSTVTVDSYRGKHRTFVDTPGILRTSDTETTRIAIHALDEHDLVLVVVQATSLDEDLSEMLPLVKDRRGAIVVTFWDKIQPGDAAQQALARLSREIGVPLIPVDARKLNADDHSTIEAAFENPSMFERDQLTTRAGWRIEPRRGPLEHRVIGPILAILLLVAPALATIFIANRLADWLHPCIAAGLDPMVAWINSNAPSWLQSILTAKHGEFGYGLLNMGPFLLVWALPTVLLFAVILAAYKTSGLVERMNVALHPLVRPLGLSGRDVVRVMMGFGCNVPAVISTRACSRCSRNTAIAAISFGAACSYQLPATLAVLSAAAVATGRSATLLTLVYLGYLLATTIIYLWVTSPREAKSSLNVLMIPSRPFMQWPTVASIWRESKSTVKQFLLQAMPIFVVICIIASLMARFGVLDTFSSLLGPTMGLFNLPKDASLPILLASIRKDGIFLFASDDALAFPMSASQVLTAVYLASVLLPCLVTALTIARETTWLNATTMLWKQASFAILFALVLAWIGRLLI